MGTLWRQRISYANQHRPFNYMCPLETLQVEKEKSDQGQDKFAEESAMGMKNYYQVMLHAVVEQWKNFFVEGCLSPKIACDGGSCHE